MANGDVAVVWRFMTFRLLEKDQSMSCPALCRASTTSTQTWVAGTGPAMTNNERLFLPDIEAVLFLQAQPAVSAMFCRPLRVAPGAAAGTLLPIWDHRRAVEPA